MCLHVYVCIYEHTHTGRYDFCPFFSYLCSYLLFMCCVVYIYYIEGLSFKLACLALDPQSVPGRICT